MFRRPPGADFYALIPLIGFNVVGSDQLVRNDIFEARVYADWLEEIWESNNPADLNLDGMRGFTLLVFTPLFIPLGLLAFATLRVLSKSRRGMGLVVFSALLLMVEGFMLVGSIQTPWDEFSEYRNSARTYTHNASRHQPDDGVLTLLSTLPKERDTARWVGLMHSIHEIATHEELQNSTLVQAQEIVVEQAINPRRTALARSAAIALLDVLTPVYPDEESFQNGVPQSVLSFLARSNDRVDYSVEMALQPTLSRSSDPRLSLYFWNRLRSYNRHWAKKWWETRAPLSALQDFGAFVSQQPWYEIEAWLNALDRTTNPDFRQNHEVRAALLGPLTEHESSSVSEHAQRLISLQLTHGEW